MSGPGLWAGRLVVGLEGTWPTAGEWAWLEAWRPAGVILFSRNTDSAVQLAGLVEALRAGRPDLLVCADHEGGAVSQLARALGRPPAAWSLGRVDDPELTRRVHRETGRRLRQVGVDMVLGPCADILTERRNPVIGARAFGAAADLVTRHVVAAVQGLREAGVRSCLKHWPGHGGTGTDSHLETPEVMVAPEQAAVFQAGLAAGAEGVMLGHLQVRDAGGADARRSGDPPVTLSSDDLAATRERLAVPGRRWLMVADDVSMGALREPMRRRGVIVPGDPGSGMLPVENLPLAWFEALGAAGSDLLLVRGLPVGAFPLAEQRPSRNEDRPAGSDLLRPDAAPYREARRRSASGVLPAAGKPLEMLDLAAHDRWQVAIGTGKEEHRRLLEELAVRHHPLGRTTDLKAAATGTGDLEGLLVASHRPLPTDWFAGPWFRSVQPRLGPNGVCLVMGHPSLARDVQAQLPAEWSISACHDVNWDDLEPGSGPGSEPANGV